MKQLLTLNEQIEELKWQRKLRGYQLGAGSQFNSSCNMDTSSASVCTLSDGEGDSMMDCRNARGTTATEIFPSKYPSPSSLSIYSDHGSIERELAAVGRTAVIVQGPAGKSATVPGPSIRNSAAPGPSKLLQDNTHLLKGTDSTSDLGSSDELVTSLTDLTLRQSSTGMASSKNSGEQQSFDSGIHDPQHDHTQQTLLTVNNRNTQENTL